MKNKLSGVKTKIIGALLAGVFGFLVGWYGTDGATLLLWKDVQEDNADKMDAVNIADVSGEAPKQDGETQETERKSVSGADASDDDIKAQVINEEIDTAEEVPAQKQSDENLHAQSGLFYYEKLDDAGKEVYCQIYTAMVSRQEQVLSTLDTEFAGEVFQYILWDHPEIFYTNGYNIVQQSRGGELVKLIMQPIYQMTEEEVKSNQALINAYVAQLRENLPDSLDTYGKIKFVYEYLIGQTEYELGCENSQNICSVFILHKSVCAGYTKATQYLLGKLGIPATVVHGMVSGEGHAWNLVWVEGAPYYLDTTWGDASYTFVADTPEYDASKVPPVNYDYFLITEQELLTTHIIEHPEYYPQVTDVEYNYYRHEGLYFESYDKEKLRGVFDKAYADGQSNITIQCATAQLMEQMRSSLLDEQEIFSYVNGLNRFYYNINELMHTMTFWLE